jgi:hypothetical protein
MVNMFQMPKIHMYNILIEFGMTANVLVGQWLMPKMGLLGTSKMHTMCLPKVLHVHLKTISNA